MSIDLFIRERLDEGLGTSRLTMRCSEIGRNFRIAETAGSFSIVMVTSKIVPSGQNSTHGCWNAWRHSSGPSRSEYVHSI